jgi:hypothetical protein
LISDFIPVPQGKGALFRELHAVVTKIIDFILDACKLILSNSKLHSNPSSPLVVGEREDVMI